MRYRLFLDDERVPASDDGPAWIIARSTKEAVQVVKSHGLPEFISFDHDLGEGDTSIDFIHWLIDTTLDSIELGANPKFPNYTVHSQNPVGKENIESLMDSFLKHLENLK